KRAFLEGQHFSRLGPCPFRANHEGDACTKPVRCNFQSLHSAVTIRAIDCDHIHKSHPETENRRIQELFLRNYPHSTTRKAEQWRRIKIRLVVSHEHVRLFWIEMLAASDVHLHAREPQPIAGTPICPPINPVLTLEQTSEQQHGRCNDQQ